MKARTVICENCRGTGDSPSPWAAECAVCDGAGTLPCRGEARPLRLALFRLLFGKDATTTATEAK